MVSSSTMDPGPKRSMDSMGNGSFPKWPDFHRNVANQLDVQVPQLPVAFEPLPGETPRRGCTSLRRTDRSKDHLAAALRPSTPVAFLSKSYLQFGSVKRITASRANPPRQAAASRCQDSLPPLGGRTPLPPAHPATLHRLFPKSIRSNSGADLDLV